MRGRWAAAFVAERFPRFALFGLRVRGDALGRAGEALAARALVARGWSLCGQRLRTPWAEVDLALRDGTTLVVVEVKTGRTRPGRRWRPADRFGPRDRRRVERAARWLARAARAERWRVDVVEVFVEDDSRSTHVVHHPSAGR